MKKAILAATALCAGSLMADGISSPNVVGYQSNDWTDKTMCCVSFGFVGVGTRTTDSDGTFKLKDIVGEGFVVGSDILQTLEPDEADMDEGFTYLDLANAGGNPAFVGWWDYEITEMKGETEFPITQGFLGNFGGNAVKFTTAGEVITDGATTLDYEGLTMVMVPNILPRSVSLGEIVATGFVVGSDILQELEPDEADMLAGYTYLDLANAGGNPAYVGWWDYEITEMKNDVVFLPGEAMLGNFGSTNVTLTFPGALTVSE